MLLPLGARHEGRETMRRGWEGYLALVPDFRIEVERAFEDGGAVALFGTASGTFAPDGVLRPEFRWQVPSAWRAVVAGGRIARRCPRFSA